MITKLKNLILITSFFLSLFTGPVFNYEKHVVNVDIKIDIFSVVIIDSE